MSWENGFFILLPQIGRRLASGLRWLYNFAVSIIYEIVDSGKWEFSPPLFLKLGLAISATQCYNTFCCKDAPVVQWIERQIPVLNVGGSSPFGCMRKTASKLLKSDYEAVFCYLFSVFSECESLSSTHKLEFAGV